MPAYLEKPDHDAIHYLEDPPERVELDVNDETVEKNLFVRNTAQAALNNLETVLRLVEGGKLNVSAKTGRPSTSQQKKLAGLLQGGDWYHEADIQDGIGYIQAFSWPVMLQGTGLAKAENGPLKLTPEGKKGLKGDLPRVIRESFSKWQNSSFLDEFSRVDKIKGQAAAGRRALFSAASRRSVLYEGLSLCTPGRWLSVKDLYRAMQATGMDFEVARYARKLYVVNAQHGHLDEYGDQAMVKIRYLLAFLFEYAATLGIIDVGYIHPTGALSDFHRLWGWEDLNGGRFLSRYDGLIYIRVNALGAFAMGKTDPYAAVPARNRTALTILPNHDIVVTDENALSPADRLFLESVSRKKSKALRQLSISSLLDCAQNGTPIEEVKAFLKARSFNPLPETVKALLKDAGGRCAGKVRDER